MRLSEVLRTRLKERRNELRMGQREVARRMSTTQSAISELEVGITGSCTVATLEKWVEALELCIEINLVDPKNVRSVVRRM